MIPLKSLKKIIFVLLIILYAVQLAKAETYTVNSTGSDSDQNVINAALEQAAQTGTPDSPSTVFLNSGTYYVTGTCVIGSNIILTGAKDAIICVSSSSSQWFTGSTGIISCQGTVHNVEISGFQITGNCVNLDNSLANTPGHDKDCERCIILHGSTGDYASDISIHDMTLYDSFSDGMYIYYANNVHVYNNFDSNTQHEGVFWSCVNYGLLENCQIAGITSDCARLDNCQKCKVQNNVFFSYNGTHNNGAYEHGENGVQVGNAGSSHGYDARNKPQFTQNVEICNNTFANVGREAITGSMGPNVYVHDNNFIGEEALETMGIPVGDLNGSFNESNYPTKEMSENVFSSIFDILNQAVVNNGITNQTGDQINYAVQTTSMGQISGGVKIIGFKNMITIDNKTYIPDTNSTIVKSLVIANPVYAITGTHIDKDLNVKIVNGIANATLNVTMKYSSSITDPITRQTHTKSKTAHATFTDSAEAPDIFVQPTNITGIIYQYSTFFMVSVPPEGLTEVHYYYDGNSSNHIYLEGTRNFTSSGVEFTEFSHLDHWEGYLQHQSNWLYVLGSFDKNKLIVDAYTPYKQIKVKDFRIIKKDYPDEIISKWFYIEVSFILLCIVFGKHFWNQIFR